MLKAGSTLTQSTPSPAYTWKEPEAVTLRVRVVSCAGQVNASGVMLIRASSEISALSLPPQLHAAMAKKTGMIFFNGCIDYTSGRISMPSISISVPAGMRPKSKMIIKVWSSITMETGALETVKQSYAATEQVLS